MKKFISRLAIILATVLSATLIMPIAACKSGTSTIKVVSMGGIALPNVQVKINRDGSEFLTGVTNGQGEWQVKFEGGNYTAEIVGGLPVGYKADSSYKLDTSKDVISLGVSSEIIKEPIPSDKRFVVGDIMYDFTLETVYSYSSNGTVKTQSITLSEVLAEKKAVMLNFFYTTCYWCNEEYPSMRTAYDEYKDDLEIIAIDNYATDNNTLVANEVITKQVPFYMGMDTAGVISHFNMRGYPTSVMIDRYGVVCEFSETITDVAVWRNWFAKYTSDNYSQDINMGNDVTDDTIFVPDNPADFDVHMPASSEINGRINKTNTNITFTVDENENVWPWDFADDGESIYPTNTGHRETSGIIYASLNFPANTVLAFDYKVSSSEDADYFYVAVDGRNGIGKQTLRDSGNKDWQKGIAYVSIEAGVHEIAFLYSRNSVNGAHDDTVYVKNLRFESISSLDNTDGIDIPYFAARANNAATGGFDVYSSVYFNDADGFYHVGSASAQNANDPVLYADIHNATPYFSSPKESIYNKYIATDKCTFGNKNYYNLMRSYSTYATNSDISGLVPVTDELQKALNALYNEENKSHQSHYSPNGWLEFCVFYKHYGPGEGYGNIIKGLAPFTAYEAHETTGEPDTGNLNEVNFEKIFMPRGLLYKFIPSRSGAYLFKGVSSQGTDAWLYDDSLTLSPAVQSDINSSGFDDFERDPVGEIYDPDNDTKKTDFKMYQYLEEGRTYYVMPAFHVVEELGSFKFRIDYIGTEHYNLETVTAGFYSLDENGKIVLPVYADVEFRGTHENGLFYDINSNRPIYCDFTSVSRMFTPYSIERILSSNNAAYRDFFNFTGYSVTVGGQVYNGADYTEKMKEYLAKAKDKETTNELYGMIEVDWDLQIILRLVYEKHIGNDDDNEWMKACWYYVRIGA